MTTDDPVRVLLRLDRNPLLVSVLRSAVHFQAMQAGLDTKGSTDLAESSEEVCRERLSHADGEDSALEVALHIFADRIEIGIQSRGRTIPSVETEPKTNSLGGEVGSKAIGNELEVYPRVDRVIHHSENGFSQTTLVKFLPRKQ